MFTKIINRERVIRKINKQVKIQNKANNKLKFFQHSVSPQKDIDQVVEATLTGTRTSDNMPCFNQGMQGTCFANSLAVTYLKSIGIMMNNANINNESSKLVPSRLYLQTAQNLLSNGLNPSFFLRNPNNKIFTTANDEKEDLDDDNGGICTITPMQMLFGVYSENQWNYVKPYVSQFDVFYIPSSDNPLYNVGSNDVGNLKITSYKNCFANGHQSTISVDNAGNLTYHDTSLNDSQYYYITTKVPDSGSYAVTKELFEIIQTLVNAENANYLPSDSSYVLNFVKNMALDIQNGKFLSIGFMVFSDFSNPITSENGLYIPDITSTKKYTKDNCEGGHAVTITNILSKTTLMDMYNSNQNCITAINGVSSNYWLEIKNSWDNTWGRNGYFYVPLYNFIYACIDNNSFGVPSHFMMPVFTIGYTTI